ncbi:hypothetical protein [Ruminococcus callidus]|uniref:hypothetical protein n=1 Tax=Ruminococcus callidus TaxID=40519 RepID=UPI00399F1B85
MKATVFQEHLEKNCRRCLELEPVFTRNICGFSSIILLQTRQKYAGGLSPGKYFSRSMQQNLPKRHVYTLVKTGSYIQKYVIDKKQENGSKIFLLTTPQSQIRLWHTLGNVLITTAECALR